MEYIAAERPMPFSQWMRTRAPAASGDEVTHEAGAQRRAK
jgi:hypothetical protein